jgi:hypothetical protein
MAFEFELVGLLARAGMVGWNWLVPSPAAGSKLLNRLLIFSILLSSLFPLNRAKSLQAG